MIQKLLKASGIILVLITSLSSCYSDKSESKTNSHSINSFEENTHLELIDIGDTKLGVRHHKGKGAPLVFIHGSLDNNSAWLSVASNLSKTIPNPIILFDLRGHSASKLTNEEQGSINQDADDAVKLLKKLGYSEAHFIGHSYGANINIKIANKYPDNTLSISLYEPPVFGLLFGNPKYEEDLKVSMKSIMTTQSLLTEGQIEKGIQLFIEKVAFGEGSWKNELDENTRSTMLSNYKTYIDQANDKERLNLNLPNLNSYNGKIIILQGTKSMKLLSASTNELKEVLNNEKAFIIDGAKHNGIYTHPEQVATIIKENILLRL